jgi:methionyl-tRNA formyltransferase
MALRVIFFGTPAFAVPSLRALSDSPHAVVAVVTQPDRPRGRGHKPQPEAIKRTADSEGLRIMQPQRLKDAAWLNEVVALQPDLAVVAAYGRLLPQQLLDIPRLGFINVHASLLPRWRGAAPVHRAILAGDRETGITIMRVVLALDAGPMLARESTAIDRDETSVELEARLAAIGGRLTRSVVDRLEYEAIPAEPQDDTQATYAAKLERADGRLDWHVPALAVHNRIRGLQPWPLAAVQWYGRRLLLLRSVVEHQESVPQPPGTVIAATHDGLLVAAQPGVVRVLELQPEGRRTMTIRDFLNGARMQTGDRLETD